MGEVLVPGNHRQALSHELAVALPSALPMAVIRWCPCLSSQCPRCQSGGILGGTACLLPAVVGQGGMLCSCLPDRILVESLGWSSRHSDYSSSHLCLASADFLERFYLCNWLDGLSAASQSALLKTNKQKPVLQ